MDVFISRSNGTTSFMLDKWMLDNEWKELHPGCFRHSYGTRRALDGLDVLPLREHQAVQPVSEHTSAQADADVYYV